MSGSNLFDRAGAELQAQEPASDFNLTEWLQIVRRRWLLLATAVVIGLTSAAVHYVMTPPSYQASAVLQIERRSLTPLV
ncbi:MAG TPA: Wzz/FepE/Etk N-terminal domain-containing protein, partial [Thermoanaerobaculia bacterium]|nr:Wzz/FepE/Etk N-terminal domain-containing protein [Thermoanaerobaculia bacterium]